MRRALVLCGLVASCAAGEAPSGATPDVDNDVIEAAVDAASDKPDVTPLDDVPDASQPLDAADVTVADVADVSDAPDAPDGIDAPADVRDAMFDVRDELTDAPRDVTPAPDAGALGDSVPAGAVMFFTAARCPDGWLAYDNAAGRVVVPTTGGAAGGEVRGLPLRNGEERTHTHRLSSGFSLGDVSYVGIVGGGNRGVGSSGAVTFSTNTEPASNGVPYVQLLVCRKTAAAVTRTLPLPTGMMMFFAGDRCPAGFSQPAGSQGRVTIGLPDGATNGATFGGTPLGMVEGPTHTHPANVSVSVGPHGIALASGCCGSGFARAGSYSATATTAASEPELPTITLLQCMKD